MDSFVAVMDYVSLALEVIGVGTIVLGFVYAVLLAARQSLTGHRDCAYTTLRRVFGKSILLGLEILVAADIIRTVAVDPTLDNLYVLGLLVVIRTFLSFSLEVEIEGQWPWKKGPAESD